MAETETALLRQSLSRLERREKFAATGSEQNVWRGSGNRRDIRL